jgi:hypothetical protein
MNGGWPRGIDREVVGDVVDVEGDRDECRAQVGCPEAQLSAFGGQVDPGEALRDRVRQPAVASPQLGSETLGERQVMGVVAGRQREVAGKSESVEMENGIAVEAQGQRQG